MKVRTSIAVVVSSSNTIENQCVTDIAGRLKNNDRPITEFPMQDGLWRDPWVHKLGIYFRLLLSMGQGIQKRLFTTVFVD